MIKYNLVDNAPSPVGNYPHSIEINGIIYISGIGPRNYKNNDIPGNVYDDNGNLVNYNIETQTHSVFANLKTILDGSHSSWDKLIDITVFLTDMKNDFKKFNKIYSQYFPNSHACRTTIEINALPTDIAIEIKCLALNKEKNT